jgi:predicted transcriptional regulator
MTETVGQEPEQLVSREEGKYLPPIHRIVLPKTGTQSALIRWLWEMGYQVKDISNGLGIRYQQVRNIITTKPKRAAREDLPPLELELAPLEDIVDVLLGAEFDRTHLAARKAERRETNRMRREEESLEPAGFELDQEDYREGE